ncbi:MAG TPA: XdhC family protein [Gemmatimonadota bacterium]|nr:XdhC family protein [Gemmatimonadota bacterium]
MSEARRALEALVEAADAGRPVVLATIVRAKGSTPRGVGSRMVIDPAEGAVGTIGGGCGEAQVISEAVETLRNGRPRVVRVDLTEDDLGWSPAICGGIFDVLLEPLREDCGGR